ncbi:hypothetical protein KAJ87_04225 [Candidatus Pacearchaeota archaeon]|nr:hypothetical protein [Candidatus Pacearchaeota archaeon]
MKQELENMIGMYQPMISKEKQQTYFVVGDLESLSANALYSGKLYIKDFSDGSSLHIHEVKDKVTGANIRGKGETKGVPLSNYQAMMLDILPGKVKIKKDY